MELYMHHDISTAQNLRTWCLALLVHQRVMVMAEASTAQICGALGN